MQGNSIFIRTISTAPVSVRGAFANLDEIGQLSFLSEYKRRRKGTGAAYVLWFLLGWHYAYVGKWGVQFLYWVSFGGFGVWALFDLFRVPGIVRRVNADIAISTMLEVKALSG